MWKALKMRPDLQSDSTSSQRRGSRFSLASEQARFPLPEAALGLYEG